VPVQTLVATAFERLFYKGSLFLTSLYPVSFTFDLHAPSLGSLDGENPVPKKARVRGLVFWFFFIYFVFLPNRLFLICDHVFFFEVARWA